MSKNRQQQPQQPMQVRDTNVGALESPYKVLACNEKERFCVAEYSVVRHDGTTELVCRDCLGSGSSFKTATNIAPVFNKEKA
jgi:hypothetical protein